MAVDLTGGALAPGLTAEAGAGAISEIEISVDLRSGSSEEVAVIGSATADTAVFGTAGARLNDDTDVDLTFSGLDQVELDGNNGADTLSTGGGGGSGEPISRPADIDGGNGSDALTGGRGTDLIQGGADDSPAVPGDDIRGGRGSDTLAGGPGNDQVLGGDGNDNVDGNLGDDVINGGPDGDTIGYYGGGATLDGADDIIGGAGSDTLYLTSRTQNVIVKLDDLANDGGDVAADGTAEEADNVEHDVEGIRTGLGNDLIDARFRYARLFTHQFEGNNGNDTLYGGDANDTLYGGQGNDTIDGGAEDDTVDGSAGTDTLKGGVGDDDLYPGADNDTVDAGDGDDYLDGGGSTPTGSDTWTGGPGYDRYYVGGRTADLTIDLDNQPDDGVVGEGDNVRSDIERFDLGAGNDTLNIAIGASLNGRRGQRGLRQQRQRHDQVRSRRGLRRRRCRQRRDHRRRRRGPSLRGRRRRPLPDGGRVLRPHRRGRRRRGQRHRDVRLVRREAQLPVAKALSYHLTHGGELDSTWNRSSRCCESRIPGWPRKKSPGTNQMRTPITSSPSLLR